MSDLFQQEIKFLTGVGPKRADLLNTELNISTYNDLITYFPYKYIDRSKFYTSRQIGSDLSYIQLKGKIRGFRLEGNRGRKKLVAEFYDSEGSISLIWFHGIKWIKDSLSENKEYVVFGKPSIYQREIHLIHPEIDELSKKEGKLSSGLQALYSTTEKLKTNYISSKTILKLQHNLLQKISESIYETLPAYLVNKLNLISRKEALINIHLPENPELLKKATFRLKFEELFYIQLNLLKLKTTREIKFKGYVFSKVGDNLNNFYHQCLPFSLTEAQKRVIREIRSDLGSGKQMNRLLQGDVGSGKTMVALMSILIALDNGFQTCLMAPTEILAKQHFKTLSKFTEKLNIPISLLTGSTKKANRKIIHKDLQSGQLSIIIGTHALIEDTVIFKNLGLVIIDEQHRFGVSQRSKLWKKNVHPPHVLVMTATPIPRTLAMTLYGDLDVSVIDELPPGRKPIKTLHFFDSQRNRVFGFIRKQIAAGQQVFIVYPLIKESEKMDYKDLEDGYESISRAFPSPEYAVSVVHGKMKPEEKEASMQHFVAGRTQIMVATTVIEVGVDIPKASVMVIESAERFGLSQLHQLRGRVGRGSEQSYCLLMSSFKLSSEAKRRLETMVRTNDGFEIAEVDLKLRGPGDIEGTQQSGIAFNLKIANLGQDGQILQYARNIAEQIFEKDPGLSHPENRILVTQLQALKDSSINWSVIS